MNERIKHIRNNLKLTQAEFAQRIGSTQNSIAGYESGRRTPSSAVISYICKEFNVNEDWLRNGTGNAFLPLNRENQLMKWAGAVLKNEDESFKKRFISMLQELDEEDWAVLEKMAIALYKKS